MSATGNDTVATYLATFDDGVYWYTQSTTFTVHDEYSFSEYLDDLNMLMAMVDVQDSIWTGSAYATTRCFPDTNGHRAETFICWLKDNGLTAGYGDGTYRPNNGVTRAEMSVFLQKIFNLADTSAKAYAHSLVNVPPISGQLLIAAGANNYVPLSAT